MRFLLSPRDREVARFSSTYRLAIPPLDTRSTLPPSLTILSWNAYGLNTPEKRSRVLKKLQRHKFKIAFIQETHFRINSIQKLSDAHYPVDHAANQDSKSREVAILIAKHVPSTLSQAVADKEGRYLFLKGKFETNLATTANVYIPNKGQVTFMRHICCRLLDFSQGMLIFSGDLNVPLNPLLDSSSTGASVLPFPHYVASTCLGGNHASYGEGLHTFLTRPQ